LQIYRFTWTMAMSIVHRATGMALYAGMVLVVVWLLAVASGPEAYALVHSGFASWIGLIVLIGFTWALIHHLIGGIRHLVWDTGVGLTAPARFLWAKGTLVGSVVLTVLLWLGIFVGA
jgi:succinate dehydrogenase / fumarate reductase cytochrome b subunit